MIAVHGEKRGLHDLLSDTAVVYCHKKEVVVETPIAYKEIPQVYMPADYVIPDEQEILDDILQEEMQEMISEDDVEIEVHDSIENEISF